MPENAEITIADVARLAGVSVSTVSRILNNKPDVSPATRERVENLIKNLGYTPHFQAQRLAAGKTNTIALLLPLEQVASTQLLELDFIAGIATAAGEESYFFTLTTVAETENDLLGLYRGARADGVILMRILMQDWRVDLLKSRNFPFVMIGRCADNTGLSYIDLDFKNAVIMAFDYLVELGHKHIGFLTRPHRAYEQGYGPAVQSLRGYHEVRQGHRLAPLYRETELSSEDTKRAVCELLDENPLLTAIVTTNGETAIDIIRTVGDRGRRVPDDVAVVAVATNRTAELITPPLTTIRLPTNTMGYRAAKMLIHKLEGKPQEEEQILIPPELVVRASTAPA